MSGQISEELRRRYVLDNYVCDEYIFNSNFDSGNLRKVEFVRRASETEISDHIVHVEFNVWTAPDCYGTPNESPNRTWFFFSIRGGRPNKNVRINIKNLNRQAKLFNQGMQPVMRLGHTGKWERIRDKPICFMELENFEMSFIHRSGSMPLVECFYAFTYPFTYLEHLAMLESLDNKYQKSERDMQVFISRLCPSDDRDDNKMAEIPLINREDFINTGYTPSFYELLSMHELQEEIYYHRELLISSLENRRIDLLTITSFHGIQDQLEEKLPDLFPAHDELRCRTFKDKKIIFLSSRVHPGETPASFVLNGFINALLDKKSAVSAQLRKMYVFKIVPFLNPDGVVRGHYRTDTLGQNLNRMYLNPKLDRHPSIYAVKKLIRYYHLGYDAGEEDSISIYYSISDNSSSSSISEGPKREKPDEPEEPAPPPAPAPVQQEEAPIKEIYPDKLLASSDSYKETSSESEFNVRNNNPDNNSSSNNNNNNNISNRNKETKSRVFHERLIPEIKPVANEPPPASKKATSKKISEPKLKKANFKSVIPAVTSPQKSLRNKTKDHAAMQQRAIKQKKKNDIIGLRIQKNLTGSKFPTKKSNVLATSQNSSSPEFTSRSESVYLSPSLMDKGNIFLYIDFHGHASKKGIFMYGNHFPNTPEAIECMLLPRLMSMNSHHFHYDACNFSERNMYKREKRDGLSKEGSGRVAVYKMTGLIKSYTLESNYNTGRYVNILPGRGRDNTMKGLSINPPKYNVQVFEETGRALGASILDLTNSNSMTRIHNSDFRSLQGLRVTIRNEIERNYAIRSAVHVPATAKVLSAHQNVKRIKRNTLSASSALALPPNGTAKENKAYYSWDSGIPSASSSLLQHNNNLQQKTPSTKVLKTTKKASLKTRSATFYGKKDTKKKTKSLSDISVGQPKKDQIFQVPPKKVKRSTTIATQTTAKIVETLQNDHDCILIAYEPVSGGMPGKCSKSDDALMTDSNTSSQTNNQANTKLTMKFTNAAQLTTERFDKTQSDSGVENSGNRSSLSASGMSSNNNNNNNTATKNTVVDDAVPCCSRMLLHPRSSHANRKDKLSSSSTEVSNDVNLNIKKSSKIGGSDGLKMIRKKRIVRHDSIKVKHKKSKFKKSTFN